MTQNIEELEIKIAFLEDLVESLGQSVTELSEKWRAQNEEAELLKLRVKRLEQVAGPEITDAPPPHY
ncbi:MAG: SlyX family protein [Gammaproteobacteria bacterium]|nr:SlyX family protein [Gammaproteobacteria bacterium]